MISIIVPSYNIEQYIERCIESIIAQTYKDWELLIINDGATDKTPQIIEQYVSKDSRIKVFHKKNGGVSTARNLGLDNAKGDFISIIDGDDWVEPTLYEDAINAINKYNVDVFMFEYFVDYNNKKIQHKINSQNYGIISVEAGLIHSITPHNRFAWSKVFSSKLLLTKQDLSGQLRFDNNIILGEDSLFIIEVMTRAHSIYYSENAYYHYDQREGSAVRSKFNKKKISGLDSYTKILDIFKCHNYNKAYIYGCGALLSLGIQLGRHVMKSDLKDDNSIEIINKYLEPIKLFVIKNQLIDKKIRIKALMSLFSLKMTCSFLNWIC